MASLISDNLVDVMLLVDVHVFDRTKVRSADDIQKLNAKLYSLFPRLGKVGEHIHETIGTGSDCVMGR